MATTTISPLQDAEAGLGRAFAIGSLIGFAVLLVSFTAVTWLAGASPIAAIGVGAFTGFWGGPGFGGMMGATLHHSRRDDHGADRRAGGGQ